MLTPPPLPVDLVTLTTMGVGAWLGAAGAQAAAPHLVVLGVALVASAIAAGFQDTQGEKKSTLRIIATHTATALLVALPLAVLFGRVDGSLLDWRWLLAPITGFVAFVGPAWIVSTVKGWVRSKVPRAPDDAQETKQ